MSPMMQHLLRPRSLFAPVFYCNDIRRRRYCWLILLIWHFKWNGKMPENVIKRLRERKGEKEKACGNRIRKKFNNIKGKEMYLLSPHPDSSFCVCFELVFIKLLKYFGLLFAFSQNNCRSNEQRKLKIGWRVPLDERRVDISDDI